MNCCKHYTQIYTTPCTKSLSLCIGRLEVIYLLWVSACDNWNLTWDNIIDKCFTQGYYVVSLISHSPLHHTGLLHKQLITGEQRSSGKITHSILVTESIIKTTCGPFHVFSGLKMYNHSEVVKDELHNAIN